MYRDKYFREWFGPVPFNFAEIMRLGPQLKQPGLYQILYKGKPVYIGVSSVSIFTRLRRHVTGAGNQKASLVAGTKDYEFVYWFCDDKTARQIESHVLVNEAPGFNMKIEYINYIVSITVH
jgi:hypothetical protein